MYKLLSCINYLKKNINYYLLVFSIIFIFNLYNIKFLLDLTIKPFHKITSTIGNVNLISSKLGQLLFLHIKITLFYSIFLFFPVFIYILLTKLLKIKKNTKILTLKLSVFFVASFIISYLYLLPITLKIILEYNKKLNIYGLYDINYYILASIKIIILYVFIITLPLVTYILAKIKIITPKDLTKLRNKVYSLLIVFTIFIISISTKFFYIPIIIIIYYEVCIIFSKISYGKY